MSDIQNGREETALAVPREFKNEMEIINWLQNNETPLSMVAVREGRGGHAFHYLRHQYVTETLNKITRFNWDFRVLRERMDEDCVTVLGELTLRIGDNEIVKTHYGSSDVKRSKDNKPLSIGDDFKAAASDALKKCASLLGLGLDLSTPAKQKTLTKMHAVGMQVFNGQWDAKRHKAVRCITGGKKKSSKELTEVEARILIAILEGDMEAEIVQDAARTLN